MRNLLQNDNSNTNSSRIFCAAFFYEQTIFVVVTESDQFSGACIYEVSSMLE